MYNYWNGCAENGGKVPLASSQVVGGSNPSGCAELINDLTHIRKLASAHKIKNIKVVIDVWGTIVGRVYINSFQT